MTRGGTRWEDLGLDLRPCGTRAAYRRHQRRGEPIDEACRQAESRYHQDNYNPAKRHHRWITRGT